MGGYFLLLISNFSQVFPDSDVRSALFAFALNFKQNRLALFPQDDFVSGGKLFVALGDLNTIDKNKAGLNELRGLCPRKGKSAAANRVKPQRGNGKENVLRSLALLQKSVHSGIVYRYACATGAFQVFENEPFHRGKAEQKAAAVVRNDISERFPAKSESHQRSEIVAVGKLREPVLFKPQEGKRTVLRKGTKKILGVVLLKKARNKNGAKPFRPVIAAVI